MQIHHPSRELAIFGRRRRIVLVLLFSSGWVVKSPMFYIALPPLHHGAAHSALPTLPIAGSISLWKMQVLIRHDQILSNPAKTKFAVRFFERKRMGWRRFFTIQKPFIHSPKVRGPDIE